MITCPVCINGEAGELGKLGDIQYYQCRNCAATWSDPLEQEDHTLAIVASGYDAICSCDHEWHGIQLDQLEQSGQFVLHCPGCGTDHTFDLSDIHHAY